LLLQNEHNLNSFAMLFHLLVSMGSFKVEVLSLLMHTLSCFDNLIRYSSNSQFPICMSSIKSAIKQRLCDQFIQKWFSDLDNSAREFYKVIL
jgi:hypothetical protein